MTKKISLKQLEIIGAIFGIFFGTLLHFTYEWSGNLAAVGLFSAINESVWEHTKLLFTPIVIFMIIEWFWVKDKKLLFFAKTAEIVLTALFIITFFYTYTGALGIEEILLVDIVSFVVAVIFGKALSYSILTSDYKPRLHTAFYALALFSLFIFYGFTTFNPPKIPLFQDSETETYGIQ